MPEDQRVTSYSSPIGKLQMRAATNVKHRTIVNDEQHVVGYVLFQVEAVVKKYAEAAGSSCQLNNDPTN